MFSPTTLLPLLLSLLPILPSASAHPHEPPHILAARATQEAHIRRAYIETCHTRIASRGLHQSAAERRAAFAHRALADLGTNKAEVEDKVIKRQVAGVNESHLVSGNYTADSNVFGSEASGCVLQPDVTQGPYCK